MKTLDNLSKIKKLDKSAVLRSIELLGKQCLHAFNAVYQNSSFRPIKNIENIVVAGMGGSALGARVIKSLYKDKLKVPLQVVNSYFLPGFVSKNSLIILSSYSGNTEEILSIAKQVKAKRCPALSICSGGNLWSWSKRNRIPVYKINPQYNPCGQPRMAIGYSICGQLAMLAKTGFLKVENREIEGLIKFLSRRNDDLKASLSFDNNLAKKVAFWLKGSIPVLVAAEHLKGAIYVTRNQINENAKNFAEVFYLPELNHHLMEGLRYPSTNKKNLKFLFYLSSHYLRRNQQRAKLTVGVVKKNGIKTRIYKAKSRNKLEEVFEVIQFGAYFQFYLSILNNLNPAPIPWVDYFKKHLKNLS